MRPTPVAVLAGLLLAAAVAAAADPTPAEVAKGVKPSVAAAHSGGAFATAVCVSAAGHFVAPAAVVPPGDGPVSVTLARFAGEKEQQVFRARVVRTDAAAGLTLLKADADTPLTPVAFGDETKVNELDDLLTFGFPYPDQFLTPAAQEKPTYQTLAVAKLAVSGVLKGKGEPAAFVTDRPKQPLSVGGPAVDSSGKVVGLVCESRQPGVTGQVVPANVVRRFLSTPVVTLTADAVDPARKFDPAAVRVAVFALPEQPADETVELTVAADGRERRVDMTRAKGGYEASVAPFESPDRAAVPFELTFADGAVRGQVPDRPFTAGGKALRLSGVRAVRFGQWAGAELADGTTVRGEVKGLDELPVTLGGKAVSVRTAAARELTIVRGTDPPGAYRLTAVVRRGGQEVGRAESRRFLTGTAPFGIDGMKLGLFTKPPTADAADTFVTVVGRNAIRDEESVRYAPKKVKASATPGVGWVMVELTHPYQADKEPRPSFTDTATTLTLTLPKGAKLEAGVHPVAGRGGFPLAAGVPGVSFASNIHPLDPHRGGFAIWEVETDGKGVTKLAADVILIDPNQKAPMYLSIRINSTYK